MARRDADSKLPAPEHDEVTDKALTEQRPPRERSLRILRKIPNSEFIIPNSRRRSRGRVSLETRRSLAFGGATKLLVRRDCEQSVVRIRVATRYFFASPMARRDADSKLPAPEHDEVTDKALTEQRPPRERSLRILRKIPNSRRRSRRN